MSYEELLKQHLKLKEEVLISNLPKEELISFGGLNLHENIDLNLFSDEKILLAHSCLHTLFSKKNKFADEKRIGLLHKKIVKEMEKRGFRHEYFDKLDKK